MKEIVGNVWDMLDENSAVCILTNNTVIQNYNPITMTHYVSNVMGGGIAREAADRNPGLKNLCGQAILDGNYSLGKDSQTGAEMLRFPTKDQVRCGSDMEIIADSLTMLEEYINKNPNKKIYLPRPGCGLGGLDWEDVKELCEHYLSKFDNIYIVSK